MISRFRPFSISPAKLHIPARQCCGVFTGPHLHSCLWTIDTGRYRLVLECMMKADVYTQSGPGNSP